MKLLLRGEEGLPARLHRQRYEESKMVSTLLGVAARYQMALKEPAQVQASPPKSRSQSGSAERWCTVPQKKKASKDVRPDSRPTPGKPVKPTTVKSMPDVTVKSRYRLKEHTWTQPVMQEFALGQNSVYLEPSVSSAKAHAMQLKDTQNSVALISVEPLESHAQRTKCTFVIIETAQDGTEQDRVVSGDVHTFDPVPITYIPDTQPVVCVAGPRATQVLRARVRKTAVAASVWKEVAACTQLAQLRQYVNSKRDDLHISDIFRLEADQDSVTWLQRVSQREVNAWLLAKDLEICCSPLGGENSTYINKVLWDKEIATIQCINSKFSKIPGYIGQVVIERGCGARSSVSILTQPELQLACPVERCSGYKAYQLNTMKETYLNSNVLQDGKCN